ncbi:hypothetical protein NDN08_002697 [Rhodosorus marinus]|uniref:Amino acid transporter transmembrane domain-containing protein n=1 Tax=Rhodosorus marinus TaxID=101924 RepID=A0AAV8UYR3_9RHOD|nr:hypothetical protein NDN08_002697 [Rhodosorus marinus]
MTTLEMEDGTVKGVDEQSLNENENESTQSSSISSKEAQVDEEKDLENGDDSQRTNEKLGWILIAFLLLCDIIGAGVLSMPNAAATLGWFPFFFVNTICWLFACTAGYLLWRLRMRLREDIHSYPHVMKVVFGPKARMYANATVYPILFLYVAAYCYTQGSSWYEIFKDESSLGLRFWLLIAGLVSILVAQYRSFEQMALVSATSLLFIMIPIFISFGVIAEQVTDTLNYPTGPKVLFGSASFDSSIVAAMDILYSYGGAVVFLEIMSNMREIKHFKRALTVSQTTAYTAYCTTGGVIYGLAGDADWLVSPYVGSLKPGAAKTVAEVLVIVHVALAVIVYANVLIQGVQRWVEPFVKRLVHGKLENGKRHPVALLTDGSWKARGWWLLWSSITILLATTVNIVIPSFQVLLGLVASLISSQTTLIWPGVLDLGYFFKKRVGKEHILSTISTIAIIVGSAALVLGLYGDVANIVKGS